MFKGSISVLSMVYKSEISHFYKIYKIIAFISDPHSLYNNSAVKLGPLFLSRLELEWSFS